MFHSINIFQMRKVLFLAALLLPLAGCGRGEPTPTAVAIVSTPAPIPTPVVSEPVMSVPSPIPPGQEIGISVNVDSVAGVEIEYQWTHPEGQGEILDGQGTDGITYRVPTEPGTYKIGVEITAADVVFERSVFITVGPTDTPTPTPTELPATDTPTFTSAPLEAIEIYCTDEGRSGAETIPVEPPCTVARIRIDLEERATDYGFSLWEVEAYGPDTDDTNLVTGGEAEASTEQDGPGCEGCFADKAIDGDMNTRWSSDFRDGQWLEIALPDPQVVNRIVLEWETAYAQEYCVSVIEPVIDTPTPTDTPAPMPTDTPKPQPTPVGPITLTFPEDGQEVPCLNTARGTYSSDITNPIWPVVYIGLKYHPQDVDGTAARKQPDGKWYGTVRFGNCDTPDVDRGKLFELLIVTADEQCNRAFENYISEGQSTGDWPGMDSLPGGCNEHVHIVVIRE
jgi:hypothetical protein